MTQTRRLALLIAATLVPAIAVTTSDIAPVVAASRLCRVQPGGTAALIRVERDTTLPLGIGGGRDFMSASGVRRGPRDSLLADATTQMPAAHVTLLSFDDSTRSLLASAGIADAQPVAFIRAEPYRADCRTIRWTDTMPFVVRGDTAYMRASIAPREQWFGGRPLFVIRDAWNYPYPRQRGLAFRAPPDRQLAPAAAMYSLDTTLKLRSIFSGPTDSAGRAKALAWMRANMSVADLEPVRRIVRRSVLDTDWQRVAQTPSRLRGTFRLQFEVGGERTTWYFRTYDRPEYAWNDRDSLLTTAEFLQSPYVAGYVLIGHAASSPDSIVADLQGPDGPLVWLASTDRPTTPGNESRRAFAGKLQFRLEHVPERLWSDLEAFVPKMSEMDSMLLARTNQPRPRASQHPELPLTLHLVDGGVRADTTLDARGRHFRVRLERIDTLAAVRRF